MQFVFGFGRLVAVVSLGFLGCLVAQGPLAGQAAPTDPGFRASRFANLNTADVPAPYATLAGARCDALCLGCSDFVLTEQVETCLTNDYVALEDSIEMLRVGTQQRTFGIDHVVVGLQLASKVARNPCSSISPPLLV